ncbi:hypothetical protein Scep_004299 [Stephania cephalantha]|uniref:Glycoside hydrolase family 31 TIM barrel domain-containing protein n=1 Tax=Stephania cephalantha TaxID=152367 RepID=A0AAP0KUS0_9MAGN
MGKYETITGYLNYAFSNSEALFLIFLFIRDRFPYPKALVNELHLNGFKTIWMLDPGIKHEEGYFVYDSGSKGDVWIQNVDGKPFLIFPSTLEVSNLISASEEQYYKIRLECHNVDRSVVIIFQKYLDWEVLPLMLEKEREPLLRDTLQRWSNHKKMAEDCLEKEKERVYQYLYSSSEEKLLGVVTAEGKSLVEHSKDSIRNRNDTINLSEFLTYIALVGILNNIQQSKAIKKGNQVQFSRYGNYLYTGSRRVGFVTLLSILFVIVGFSNGLCLFHFLAIEHISSISIYRMSFMSPSQLAFFNHLSLIVDPCGISSKGDVGRRPGLHRDTAVDDEAVYYKVAGDIPQRMCLRSRSLWRKKRRYVDPDASTSQC